MADVTRILHAIEQGDPSAAGQLLPLVYEELRRLAAERMAHERPATLQATALVHEAYIRLVDVEKAQHWDSRGHFFAAAAEAMRRILVERIRRKRRLKHGGDRQRIDLNANLTLEPCVDDGILALNEALARLSEVDKTSAEVVKPAALPGFPFLRSRLSWAFRLEPQTVVGRTRGLGFTKNCAGNEGVSDFFRGSFWRDCAQNSHWILEPDDSAGWRIWTN